MDVLPKRKPNRLADYDYSRPGCYFVTICARERQFLFWYGTASHMGVGADIIRPWTKWLSPLGLLVKQSIQEIPTHYPNVTLDHYVVMPNHVHILLTVDGRCGRMISAPTTGGDDGRMISAPTTTLPTIIGQMKRAVTKRAGLPIWQKGYHDHVVRSDADYLRIWSYIDTNPAKWREDCYFTETEES